MAIDISCCCPWFNCCDCAVNLEYPSAFSAIGTRIITTLDSICRNRDTKDCDLWGCLGSVVGLCQYVDVGGWWGIVGFIAMFDSIDQFISAAIGFARATTATTFGYV